MSDSCLVSAAAADIDALMCAQPVLWPRRQRGSILLCASWRQTSPQIRRGLTRILAHDQPARKRYTRSSRLKSTPRRKRWSALSIRTSCSFTWPSIGSCSTVEPCQVMCVLAVAPQQRALERQPRRSLVPSDHKVRNGGFRLFQRSRLVRRFAVLAQVDVFPPVSRLDFSPSCSIFAAHLHS